MRVFRNLTTLGQVNPVACGSQLVSGKHSDNAKHSLPYILTTMYDAWFRCIAVSNKTHGDMLWSTPNIFTRLYLAPGSWLFFKSEKIDIREKIHNLSCIWARLVYSVSETTLVIHYLWCIWPKSAICLALDAFLNIKRSPLETIKNYKTEQYRQSKMVLLKSEVK